MDFTSLEDLLTESQPIQETVSQDSQLQDIQPIEVCEVRPRQKRVPSSARRYAVYFESADHNGPCSQQSASAWLSRLEPLVELDEPQVVGSDGSGSKEDSGFHDSESPNTTLAREFWKYAHSEEARRSWGERTLDGILSHFHQRNDAERMSSEDRMDFASENDGTRGHQPVSRSASNVSNASVRSSGYYSMRNSTVSEDEPFVSEPTATLEVPEQSRSHAQSTPLTSVPESRCSSSRRSSADDSPDDDFQSCTSFESQSSEGEVLSTCSTLVPIWQSCGKMLN